MAQQRRSRFTVVLAGHEPIVILAYSAQDCVTHFNRQGKTVVSVKRGDYRKQRRSTALKAAGGFRIDQSALRDAIALLNIKLPVKIQFNGRVGGTEGIHRFDGFEHRIMLKSYLSPQKASDALWHELTHAVQAERGGTLASWRACSREQGRYPYRIRPIEVEAREMSATMADCPLTRPL